MFTLHAYQGTVNQISDDEMDGTCSTNLEDQKYTQKFIRKI